MRRRLLFAAAILASVLAFCGPLMLAGRFQSWWWLLLGLATIPACEIAWRAHGRAAGAAGGDH